MKKTFLVMATLVASLAVNAQHILTNSSNEHKHEHEGKIFSGGAISYWNDTKEKTETFDFCPEFGYLFKNNFGVGILLGYEYEVLDKSKQITNSFKVSPFFRYYYRHKEPFNFFCDTGFGFNWSNEKNTKTNVNDKLKGFEVGIRPGACIDLTEGVCLCLRMGFLGYRNEYFMGEEPKITSNGFGISFAPEELMIGLELEF